MKTLLFPLLFLIGHQSTAQADERDWAPYRKLMDTIKLDKFSAAPPALHDKVLLFATITPQNKAIKPADVVLTVVDGAARQSFRVNADRKLYMPFNAKWYADDAQILINQPKGEKMGIGFGLDAVVPEGTQWPYASLMGSVKQSNALIKSQAGMLSMFLPSMKSVVLSFARPAQLKIQGKDGVRVLATDAGHTIRLKPDEALMTENPTMSVSERPLQAELDTE